MKQRIKQLKLLKRQHSNGEPCESWTVAAWHWRWSITWRWLVTWEPPCRHTKPGAYYRRVYRGMGLNFQCALCLPLIGRLSISTQPNMPLEPAK